MLRFIDQLINQPILGIRGGGKLSETLEEIVDPHKLTVVAFYCEDSNPNEDTVLFTEDIREISDIGLIVDSEDVLMPTTDLVRLEEIIEINFDLIGKDVVTESGEKIGKVDNYTIEDKGFKIEKIYARPTAMKFISSSDFIVHRRQIVSVNENAIIVNNATISKPARARNPSLNPL